jgi:hypothetical protein
MDPSVRANSSLDEQASGKQDTRCSKRRSTEHVAEAGKACVSEAMENDTELLAFLELISSTDSDVARNEGPAESPVTRGGGGRQALGTDDETWKRFHKNVESGAVTPTMVIDFEYKPNSTLERMYCFKEAERDYRMVLHVHTLEKWPGTKNLEGGATQHARKVTSVNVRYADRVTRPYMGGPAFKQDDQGFHLVGVRDWQWRVKEGRGAETEWMWGKDDDIPPAEKKTNVKDAYKVKDAYNQVRGKCGQEMSGEGAVKQYEVQIER